ncbi:hypothetical protein TNCV_1083511 [Trichonephila clavipes]|nr:hypothetical protein TNCV_1083511 [Trichonephila clavipes]
MFLSDGQFYAKPPVLSSQASTVTTPTLLGGSQHLEKIRSSPYHGKICPPQTYMLHISGGGPIAWPPSSLDANPLDVFFWSHLKYILYLRRRWLQDLTVLIVTSADNASTPYVSV